jgi:hypothetical protein
MMNFHYINSFALNSILLTILAMFSMSLPMHSKLEQHFSSASDKAPTEGTDITSLGYIYQSIKELQASPN